ncbi:MAG: EAL domain-containing protein [Eubacteriales bacterium]|nr:EAL domain-containing protein [Eubacteriales bacterium]
MKTAYTVSLLFILIIMLGVGYRAKLKNTELAKALLRLTCAVAITVVSSVLAIFLPAEPIALVMQTVHFVATEWMFIFLLAFFERYVDGYHGKMVVRIVVYLYSAVCSVMLLLNGVFHHVVYCEYRMARGIRYRMFRTISPWYKFHSYFSYVIALLALLILIGATFKTTSFYRKKYFPAAVALLITMGLEGLCAARDSLMDYALFGYLGLAIFLIYYSVYHVNSRLITKTLSLVTTETAGGVVCFDITGKCIYANDVAFSLYKDVDELSDFETIFSKYEYGESQQDKKWTENFETNQKKQYFEINYGRLEDKKKEYIGCYFYLYDKTADVLSLEEARYQATHDGLTGIYNDDGFKQSVEQLLNEYPNEEWYIVTADIKDFKLINDLFGYETGDKVLIATANGLKSNLPEYAPCCRKTSDHFYFCMRKSDFSEKEVTAWTKSVANILTKYDFQFVMHYGVYQIQKEDGDVGIMCDYARMAEYAVKENYDHYFEYFDKKMMQEILRIKNVLRSFDDALLYDQFKMFLQPQVNTVGEVIGAEALVRWEHPTYGLLSPGEFVPVFENVGLIYKLDQYIWEQAAKKLNQWRGTEKEHFHISVNISPKDFQYIDIYETFVGLVKKYEINPKQLKLEITESAFMNEPEKQLALIAKLQAYGFYVEIDDFGSGYSSLNILKDMKVNVIKIDMGFLKKTKEVERSQIIIDTIIKLAKLLNMEVVSEGVEEKEQIEFLSEAGCDLFQGYYFDKPISVSEFERKY